MAFVNTVALQPPAWLEQSDVYHASSLRRLVKLASRGRTGMIGAADFLPSATNPNSMNVSVAPGEMIGLSPSPIYGSYIGYQDSQPLQVQVPVSDPTNPTWHLGMVQVLDPDYQGSVMGANLGIVQGTPSAQPTDPVVPTDGLYVPVFRVRLPAQATAVTPTMIDDLRQVVGFGQPPVLAAPGPPTVGAWAAGDMVIDSLGGQWVCLTAGSPGSWAQVGGRTLIQRDVIASATATTPTLNVPSCYDTIEFELYVPGGASGGPAVYLQANGQTTTTSAFAVLQTTSQAGAIQGLQATSSTGVRVGTIGTTGGGLSGRILGCQHVLYHPVLSSGFRLSTASTYQGEANQGIWAVNATVTSLNLIAANPATNFPLGTVVSWYGAQ